MHLRSNFKNTFYGISLSLLLLGTGCGGQKPLYASKSASSSFGLKKKVLVLPILNYAGLEESKARQIQSRLLETLQNNSSLLINENLDSQSFVAPALKTPVPDLDIWADANLIQKAQEQGYHLLLLPILNPFKMHEIRTGIWPLFKSKRELEISMVINVYDSVHQMVYLINIESRRITLPRLDVQGFGTFEQISDEQRWKSVPEETWQKVWSHLLDHQAKFFLKEVKKYPWNGLVAKVESEEIVINAGRESGLKEGLIFEVFEKGESVQGPDGRTVFLSGPKVGEIQIFKVLDATALAKALDKAELKAGQFIRLK